MLACCAKELRRVKTVQLRSLRIGHIDNDRVVSIARGLKIAPPIHTMNVHARIGQDSRLRRKELACHLDQRRIQLYIIDPHDAWMLQRLADRALYASADQQNPLRRGMLQQRVVHRFFGCTWVGRIRENYSVGINAADRAGLRKRPGAVNHVARPTRGAASISSGIAANAAAPANTAEPLRLIRSSSTAHMQRLSIPTTNAIWNDPRNRSSTMLAAIPPAAEPTASSK